MPSCHRIREYGMDFAAQCGVRFCSPLSEPEELGIFDARAWRLRSVFSRESANSNSHYFIFGLVHQEFEETMMHVSSIYVKGVVVKFFVKEMYKHMIFK